MSHLDEWALLIAKQLKSEAELVGTQAKSELYEDVARNSFIRVVLEPFLPASYAVGSGRVIDATGKISSAQDIVIYRNDYPQFNMPGSHSVFVYESVLATIQVSSKLVRKSFFKALDQCASMGELDPSIEPETMRALASKMNVKLNANKQYVHAEPLNTERFHLMGRPQSFVYAFTGYQTSEKQLAENLHKWIDHYHENHDVLHMKSLPSVIATQGCFAWRNTAPFTMNLPALMGVGHDNAPLRLIILQLMQALNRRLQNTSDGYGIRSNISPYLAQFKRPVISEAMGRAVNPATNKTVAARQHPPANRGKTLEADVKPVVAEKKASTVTPAQPAKVAPSQPSQTAHKPQPGAESALAAAAAKAANATASGSTGADIRQPPKTSQNPLEENTHEKDESSAPLIEDRSRPSLKSANSESELAKPAQIAGRPTSPLSLFDNEEDGDIDEYEFQPIEPPQAQSNEDDDEFESTQQIDVSDFNKQNKVMDRNLRSEPNSKSTPQSEADAGEVDQDFVDTLIEKSEVLAKDTSKPAESKPGYVKEMLI